ncbi:MAG TPA: hypothetical protein ENK56_03815 [Chloroflexi bacterium]|nr:hypothetical protein [Chloroflexota bacterium]
MRAIYLDVNVPKALLTKTLRRVWPGVVWSPLSPVHVAEVPEPPLPGPRWIRVRNRLCGICGTDLSLLFIHADPDVSPVALPGLSRFYLGHEVVSEVVEVGPGVTRVRPGDRVIMDTRFTGPTCLSQEIDPPCRHCAAGNYLLCENQSVGRGPVGVGGGWGDGYTAHESEVYPVPPDLSDDQAVLVEPYSVGLRAVLRRPPRPGERVLVLGCGIIGLLTLRVARVVAPDALIVAMARYLHQAEMARRLGADEVITDRDGYEAVARLTGGKLYKGALGNRTILGGFDVIYDAVGTARTLQDSLRWTRAGGTVVMIGISPKRFKSDLSPIWHQEVDLIGSLGHGMERWQGESVYGLELVIRWMREGRLPIEGLITHRFPLEAYKKAIATAMDKRSGAIKVVFEY